MQSRLSFSGTFCCWLCLAHTVQFSVLWSRYSRSLQASTISTGSEEHLRASCHTSPLECAQYMPFLQSTQAAVLPPLSSLTKNWPALNLVDKAVCVANPGLQIHDLTSPPLVASLLGGHRSHDMSTGTRPPATVYEAIFAKYPGAHSLVQSGEQSSDQDITESKWSFMIVWLDVGLYPIPGYVLGSHLR